MYKYLIIFLFSIILNAQNLKIASYNVENFFDLNHDKTEYNEYIPNSKSLWNQRAFDIKLKNILKVIEDLDADIIALQEIENEKLIKLLKQKLPKYSYYSFSKYPNSAIGLGFLSKIPIKNSQNLNVKFQKATYRPILETTFKLDDIEFKVFNNHWPSKKASESYRVKYAKTLFDRLKELSKDYPYILLGDFNSNYNELQTFRNTQKLNTTAGITGINHILNTTIDDKFVILDDINSFNKKVHYNLWLELPINERFSTKFRDENNTPDNMIISSSLVNNNGLYYVKDSFSVFKPIYLFEKNHIQRWKMSENRDEKIHKGEGFSDHLPIFALFSTKKSKNNIKSDKSIEKESTISSLYNKEKLIFPIFLENIIVLYKSGDKAIIKQKNNRAIYIFQGAKDLQQGFSYNIQVNQIYDFYGLKEIKDFNILKENSNIKDYKELFLDGSKIDIFDFKYENEIITNLKGFISKGKLQINGGKTIKLFAKDKNILPKDGTTIEIINAQLGSFKGNMQIIFHTKDDYKELK
ncbi:endonuclease [Aliarcobacter trophiarum LMG 25534]|uniref:Endonuclease n=1 Tax=Aliarcobacter trophiarum LMG 25534 TaxID=1032241 RepID=A0AAD0QK88_9BACT|nr:endonuclease/exonuclease/phosphatase family protein [Aliarcobacter trophiarum]AXK48951.1 endonuclease/exonuclease/phosphatase [Aliarcobacter trophiarum LMG 25534]RXI24869.1 endonuclease [Aliarcobacter trophiarum]RXJ92682.1 endonuclease [Aliarcobacter trophiarum LMG 25534]